MYCQFNGFRGLCMLTTQEAFDSITLLREKTRDRLWEITQQFNVLEEEEWRKQAATEVLNFQQEVIEAFGHGYDGTASSEISDWSFSVAFLYSLTVITTIGK
jgi:hypothetical protein